MFFSWRKHPLYRKLTANLAIILSTSCILFDSARAQPVTDRMDQIADQEHVSLIATDGSGIVDPSLLTLEHNPAGATLTIRQLFELGGQPIGPWPEGGLAWPYLELADRVANGERQTVFQVATECLSRPAALEISHAFCAYVLINFNAPGIDDLFSNVFFELNPLGQHEVLLYAYEFNKPAYAPIIADMLDGIAEWPEGDKRPFLAAVFAIEHYDPSLHAAIINYQARFQDDIQAYRYRVILDGFPYSDVVQHSVGSRDDNLEQLFEEAVRVGEQMAPLASRAATDTEQQLFHDSHAALQNVERIDLPRQERPLSDLIDELNRRFSESSFSLGRQRSADPDLMTHIGGNALSATEVLSALCNDYDLDIRYSSFPDAWHIMQRQILSGTLVIQNPCTSHARFLIRLEPRPQRSLGLIRLRVALDSDEKLPRRYASYFYLTDIESDDYKAIPTQSRLGSRLGFVSLGPVEGISDNPSTFNISGVVDILVPRVFHQIEQLILPGMQAFSLLHGPFELRYEETADAIDIRWGTPRTCCLVYSAFQPSRYSGTVRVYNAAGELIVQRHGGDRLSNDPAELTSRLYLSRNSREFQQPATLEWNVAPVLQHYSFEVEFNDVQLIDLPADADGHAPSAVPPR